MKNRTKPPRSAHRKNSVEKQPEKITVKRKKTDTNTTNKNSIVSKKDMVICSNTKNTNMKNITKNNNDDHKEVYLNKNNAIDTSIDQTQESNYRPSCVFPFLGYYL
ncbi:MAG: hypothetical protein NTU81_03085 [Candidatus Nomurabacteria bacterium]|nr:hypothetical protein [Candidatus Nomurabacteria bacterium]